MRKKIEVLTHPDFPLGTFLLEVFLWNFALLALVIGFIAVLGPDWFCLTLYFFTATFGSLNFLIWNYWSKVTIELTENSFRIQPFIFSFRPRIQSYQKYEVENIRVIQPHEKLALFEGIFGLRLISLRSQGRIGFETPQGMMVRFGWGINEAEAEEIVAIIQKWVEKGEM